jgi:hypothetical protein
VVEGSISQIWSKEFYAFLSVGHFFSGRKVRNSVKSLIDGEEIKSSGRRSVAVGKQKMFASIAVVS